MEVFSHLASDKDRMSIQTAMQVQKEFQKNLVLLYCHAIDTNEARGLSCFPTSATLKTLRFVGADIMKFFNENKKRLASLQRLKCSSKKEGGTARQQLAGDDLSAILGVATELSGLELHRLHLQRSFFDVFDVFTVGAGCLTSLSVIDCKVPHYDGYLKALKSINSLEIDFLDDEGLQDLLSLEQLKHVTIHLLEIHEDHRRADCHWDSLTLVNPFWETLNRMPLPGLDLRFDPSHEWCYFDEHANEDHASLQFFLEFESAVKLFLEHSPDQHFPNMSFENDNLTPVAINRLILLLVPLFNKYDFKLTGLAVLVRPTFETLSLLLACFEHFDYKLVQVESETVLKGHLKAILREVAADGDDDVLGAVVARHFKELLSVCDVLPAKRKDIGYWRLADSVLALIESVMWKPFAASMWGGKETDVLISFFERNPDEATYCEPLFDILARRSEDLLTKLRIRPIAPSAMRVLVNTVNLSTRDLPDRYIQEGLPVVFRERYDSWAAFMAYHWVNNGRGDDVLFHMGGLQIMTRILITSILNGDEDGLARIHAACTIAHFARSDSRDVLSVVHGEDVVREVIEFYLERPSQRPGADSKLPTGLVQKFEEFVRSLAPILIQRMWRDESSQRNGAAKVLLEVSKKESPPVLPPVSIMPPLMAMLTGQRDDLGVVVDLLSQVDFGADWCAGLVPPLTAFVECPGRSDSDPNLDRVLSLLAKVLDRHTAVAAAVGERAFEFMISLNTENSLRVLANLLSARGLEWRNTFARLGGLKVVCQKPCVFSSGTPGHEAIQRILAMFKLCEERDVIELE